MIKIIQLNYKQALQDWYQDETYQVIVAEISNFRHQAKFKRVLNGTAFYKNGEWLFEPFSPSPYKRAVKLDTQARMIVGEVIDDNAC